MHFFDLVAAAALVTVAVASPLKLRAGGPTFKPIPADCTIVNPLPHASQTCGNGTVSGSMPSQAYLDANSVYSFYLEQPDYESVNARWEGCLEQCNGFSGCTTAMLAYNVPTPEGYYGTAGGVPSVSCIFFNRTATPNDFVAALQGQYVNATAANVYCPSA